MNNLNRNVLLLVLFVLFTPVVPRCVCAAETDSGFATAEYFYNPLAWRALEDGFETVGKDASEAILRAVPISRRVVVEADITVQRAESDEWKVAGVAVFQDEHNFWHFAMVQPPDGSDRPNFCELSQMRDHLWNSQNNLHLQFHEIPGGPWKIGQTYRMKIALDPEGIEGSIHDAQGNLLERKRYTFSADAVTTGRPALRSPGFATHFRNIHISRSEPVPEPETPESAFPKYDSESFVPGVHGKKTGFFHVEQEGERWWAIDPLGRGFVPLGVDHVNYAGHWCESLGYAPYHRKMQEKYPDQEDWIQETGARLKSWGFNRLGGGAWSPMLHRGLCHSRFVSIGTAMADLGDEYDITPNEGRPCSSFPNVFHPAFEPYCRYQAERICRSGVGDPWLLGYFLDNELAWWGRGDLDTGLFDAVMKKSPQHTAKRALHDFLAERYGNDIAKLNAAWGANLAAFDDILAREELSGSNAAAVHTDKKAFLGLIADRYFTVTTDAIRDVDPDHMILGCRFAGGHAADVVWQAAAKYCDVISLNYYGNVDLDRGIALDDQHNCQGDPIEVPFARFAQLAGGRPLMVTEWAFIALDSGLPCTNGAGQRFRTQAERAKAARIYAESLLRVPQLIGFDYFMWADEPALGITPAFPENSNYGLVNEENVPYTEMVKALSSVAHQAGSLHLEGPRPRSFTTGPTKAHVPTARQFVEQRIHARTDRIKNPMRTGQSSSLPPQLTREGDSFVITNGCLRLQGRVGSGPMLGQIFFDDLALGRYNTIMHQKAGQSEWPGVNRVVDIQAKTEGQILHVDLTGRFETSDSAGRRLPYEIMQRIWIGPQVRMQDSMRQADWFVIELLSCRNMSTKPMEVRGIYFQPFSSIGGNDLAREGSTGDQPASAQRVPRLWGQLEGDAWIDETVGAFLGLVAPPGAPLSAKFWLNEYGGQHPDARWEIKRTLAPGETLQPKEPIYWIVLAGKGDQAHWETRQREIVQLPLTDQGE